MIGRTVVAAAMLLLSGCLGGGQAEAPQARQLAAGPHCGFQPPGGRWLDDAAGLRQLQRYLEQGLETRGELPEVDLAQRRVLWLAMGRQPTAGYSLSLSQQGLTVEGGVLRLPVQWQTPPEGSVTAQVVTKPCLAVSLPRDGYQAVQVVDQRGEVRLELPAR